MYVYICVHMYVCMYVCICIRMYVCMYVDICIVHVYTCTRTYLQGAEPAAQQRVALQQRHYICCFLSFVVSVTHIYTYIYIYPSFNTYIYTHIYILYSNMSGSTKNDDPRSMRETVQKRLLDDVIGNAAGEWVYIYIYICMYVCIYIHIYTYTRSQPAMRDGWFSC